MFLVYVSRLLFEMVNEWRWDALNTLPPSDHLLVALFPASDLKRPPRPDMTSPWVTWQLTSPTASSLHDPSRYGFLLLLIARKQVLRVTFLMEAVLYSRMQNSGKKHLSWADIPKLGLWFSKLFVPMFRGTAGGWVLLLPFLRDFYVISSSERCGLTSSLSCGF